MINLWYVYNEDERRMEDVKFALKAYIPFGIDHVFIAHARPITGYDHGSQHNYKKINHLP